MITVVQVEEEEEAEQPLKPSPDADTHILFVRPTSTGEKRYCLMQTHTSCSSVLQVQVRSDIA